MNKLIRTVTGIVVTGWMVGGAAACGPAPSPDGGANDGSMMMGDASMPTDGTGGGGDGGTMNDTGGGTRRSGSVFLSQTVIMAAGMSFVSSSASASFASSAGVGGTNPCMTETMGDCQVSTCTIMQSDAGTPPGDAGAMAQPHAGAITISGGAIPAGMPITLNPDANGVYMAATGMNRLWMGAQQLRVQAAGMSGGVPMFDQMVAAPGDVMVTMPTIMPGTPVAINRANAFEVRWTGGTAGRVNVSLGTFSMMSGTSRTASVICRFMASAGMGSVPSAALMRLGMGMGTISIGSASEAMVAAGNYDVLISATAGGTAGQANFN